MASSIVPISTSWPSVNRRGNRRIVITGPISDSGGMITFTRSPVGSRASTIGLDSSTRRFTCETIRSIVWKSCASLVKRDIRLLDPPVALDPHVARGR